VTVLLWEKNTVSRLISRADKLNRTGWLISWKQVYILKNSKQTFFFNWKPEQVSGIVEEAWKLEKWTYDIAGGKEKAHFTSLNYLRSLVFVPELQNR
jgi:hypothetical protein